MKKVIASLILFAIPFTKNAQENTNYSTEELKQDFAIFRASLQEGHPGIYRYSSKAKMDSVFTKAENEISKETTEYQFKLLLCKVVDQIGCGHTKVVAPKSDQDKFDEGKTAIPFQVYFYEDKLFVLRNFSLLSDNDLVGAEIISINGHDAADIINDFISVFPSDARNVSHKYRMMSSSRLFTRYFYYLYGYTESYDVVYKLREEATSKRSMLAGITFDNLLEIRKQRYPFLESEPPVEFNLLEDKKIAYLKITTFDKIALKKKGIVFQKFLKKSFKAIKNNSVQNLVLDLRYNGGGTDEFGKLLFSYFIDHPFDYYNSITMNKQSFEFFKYTNRPNAKAPKGMLEPNEKGTFNNVKHPNYGKQKPTFPTFKGAIYVLINGSCFSTTSECLSMIHSYTKAIFIGEESGGGYFGNTSGPTPDLILPNTKVRIEIPLMSYVMAVKEYAFPLNGIIPDHQVVPSVQQKISKSDPELNLSLELIRKAALK